MRTLLPRQLYTQVRSMFFGEISTNAYVDINRVVRDTIAEIGYTNTEYGFLRRRWEFIRRLLSSHQISPKELTKPWKSVEMQIKIRLT